MSKTVVVLVKADPKAITARLNGGHIDQAALRRARVLAAQGEKWRKEHANYRGHLA